MNKLAIILFIVMCCITSIFSQKVEMNPLAANESQLLKKLKSLRQSTPNLKPDEFVKKANEMLGEEALDFFLSLDSVTCAKVKAAYAAQTDKSKPLKLSANLQSSGAEKAKIALPDPIFDLDYCTGCYLKFALLEITDQHFVTKVMGHNIKLDLPAGIDATEAWLVDPTNSSNILKRWRIPSRLTPIGVSYDENVLYLDLNIPELTDISLAVFTEGTFEFATRTEAEDGGKGELANETLHNERKKMVFNRWKKKYVVSFGQTCVPQARK